MLSIYFVAVKTSKIDKINLNSEVIVNLFWDSLLESFMLDFIETTFMWKLKQKFLLGSTLCSIYFWISPRSSGWIMAVWFG